MCSNRSAVFIQLNQNHLIQNNMIMPKNYDTSPLSPTRSNAAPTTKFCKNDDMPISISASLQSSLPRTRVKKNNHNNTMRENGIINTHQHQDSNDSNDDEIDYKYNKQTHNVYYSTMNASSRDYLRKTTGHLHRNINNNSSIASTNRYRWHNQSDEIALHSLRNNRNVAATTPTTTATTTKVDAAMTMHSNHRSHTSNRKQHHLNQINNNFIISNKKQSIHNTNDDQHSIDQNNGNHYPSRLYH